MPPFRDVTNQKFEQLTALKPIGIKFKSYLWLCRCVCGNTVSVAVKDLRSGHTRSCGCLHKEGLRLRNTKHGMHKSAEYAAWTGMVQRCYNRKEPSYGNYGGRGISVYPQWRNSFESFFKDMGKRPSPQHSLDRTDNSKGYSPENCRWASKKEQMRNTRNNRILTWDGRSLLVVEWAKLTGIPAPRIRDRLEWGWSVADALSKPIRK